MDSFFLLLRVLVSLAAVFGLLFYLRKKLGTRFSAPRNEQLQILARQSIGPKASVVLIEADGQRYLLGVADSSVNLLDNFAAPVPEPGEPDEATGQHAHAEPLQSAGGSECRPGEAETGLLSALPGPAHSGQPGFRSFEDELRLHTGKRALRQSGLAPGRVRRTSPLAGSILDTQTWRDAKAALSRGTQK